MMFQRFTGAARYYKRKAKEIFSRLREKVELFLRRARFYRQKAEKAILRLRSSIERRRGYLSLRVSWWWRYFKRLTIHGKAEHLTRESGLSFVITSFGKRGELLDDKVLPSIFNQHVPRFEVIIVGRYEGKYKDASWMSVVPFERFPFYYHRPFQLGINQARLDWIVDMDDDFVLGDQWYENLLKVSSRENADVYGFSLLRPDGSVRSLVGDAFGISQEDTLIRPTSYFGSSVVRRWIYDVLPYPTYMSGDRHHGLQLYEAGFKSVHVPGADVIHYGEKGYFGQCASEQYDRVQALKKRLGWYARTVDPGYVSGMRRWWAYAKKVETYPKRIGIVGWFGHRNAGDELILRNMLSSFADHQVVVFTDMSEGVKDIHSISARPLYDLPSLLKRLDVLLVTGGGLLHDRYIKRILPPKSMDASHTPIIVYAAGVPFFEWTEDLTYFLDKCYLITVRDPQTCQFLKNKYPDYPILYLPDPGFLTPAMEVDRQARKVVLNIRSVPAGWRIGLPEDVNEIVKTQAESLYRYLIEKNNKVSVLGFEPSDAEFLESDVWTYRIVDDLTAIEEIASAECVVAMRYHAGIISFTQGVPALMIAYQPKVIDLEGVTDLGIEVVPIPDLDLVTRFKEFEACLNDKASSNDHAQKLLSIRAQIHRFHKLYGLQ
jgi:polysaccharide pyruvyl transferase WcaK-like protein